MVNNTLIKAGRDILKNLLSECTEGQQLMFKRMYSHNRLELPINEVVDKMDTNKIDWAICQCEKSVEKNRKLV
jgi:hypothetical protein